MLNTKIICKIMGSLLFIEGGMLLLCLILSICFGEEDLMAFIYSTLIACGSGALLKYYGRKAPNHMNRRDGYLVVSSSWVVFSLVGMLPFLFSGYIPSVTDAFFETMSGFTTTGATILTNIDSFPHSLLFWRSLTQWIGGLGIVFFTLAILPTIGIGDVKLFAAEATGPRHNKLHPRIKTTAKWLWTIYALLTVACAIALFFSGMNVFDSINHALTTTATGGYSTHQDGIMFFKSKPIEYVEIIFMFLAGINFTMLYLFLLKGKVKSLFRDSEFRYYLLVVIGTSLIIAATLVFSTGYDVEHALRAAFFSVVSLITTTGFVSEDYAIWVAPVWFLLNICMFSGACAGSTSGGFKCIRCVMLIKTAFNEFKHILHPNAIVPIRINHAVVSSSLERTLLAFAFFYISLIVMGGMLLVSMGLPYMDAFSIAITAHSNSGPVIGHLISPVETLASLPDAGKWVCSFLMLAGRLEIFSVLLPFVPSFWKEN
ncbi:MAG: TrkH family potassium uptake protein [Bacteroidaceae bacterium]